MHHLLGFVEDAGGKVYVTEAIYKKLWDQGLARYRVDWAIEKLHDAGQLRVRVHGLTAVIEAVRRPDAQQSARPGRRR